jgi:RNA polymerase sigma-70 factor (ECF subfamily)
MSKKEYELHSEEWFLFEVEKSKGALFYHAFKRVDGSKEDAEDLYQTTILKAWISRKRYKPTFAFSTWLFKILTNALIDFSRKKKKVALVSMSTRKIINKGDGNTVLYPFENLPSARKNMDDIVCEELLVAGIEVFAKKMSEGKSIRFGEMFLYYADNVPYGEIAKIFGVPIGTVKANIFKARERLAEKLTGKKRGKKKPKVYHQFKKIKRILVHGEVLPELILVER